MTTWSPRAHRKALYAAAAGIILAIATLWAVGQPWVAMSLSGSPTCPAVGSSPMTAQLADGQTTTLDIPNACVTGWQAQSAASNVAASSALTETFGPSTSLPSTFPSVMGVPAVAFWLVVAAFAIVAGCLIKNAIVVGLAVVPWQLASSQMGATMKNMVGGLDPSQYATMDGWAVLSVLGPLILVTLVLTTVFIAKTNYRLRKQANAGKPTVTGAVRDMMHIVARSAAMDRNPVD